MFTSRFPHFREKPAVLSNILSDQTKCCFYPIHVRSWQNTSAITSDCTIPPPTANSLIWITLEEKWKISSGTVNLITKFNKDIMLSKSFNLMEATVKEFLFEDTITSMPYPRFSVPFGSSSLETRPKENNIFPANIHSPSNASITVIENMM
jgi:hypothetical protein